MRPKPPSAGRTNDAGNSPGSAAGINKDRQKTAGAPATVHGKATAFICENGVCNLPTNDPAPVARLLRGDR